MGIHLSVTLHLPTQSVRSLTNPLSSLEAFNSCHAVFFVFIFHSFKAEIANAISSFKKRNIFIFTKNIYISSTELLD